MVSREERQAALAKQREYVREHTCPHLVACAVTDEQVAAAVEMMRSGVMPDAYLGAAMLSGPCRRKNT